MKAKCCKKTGYSQEEDLSGRFVPNEITIALMTIPNLLGMLWLHKEVKTEVKSFWNEYAERFPEEKPPRY